LYQWGDGTWPVDKGGKRGSRGKIEGEGNRGGGGYRRREERGLQAGRGVGRKVVENRGSGKKKRKLVSGGQHGQKRG